MRVDRLANVGLRIETSKTVGRIRIRIILPDPGQHLKPADGYVSQCRGTVHYSHSMYKKFKTK